MVMVSKFLNFPDELSENDKLREYELNGSDCSYLHVMVSLKLIDENAQHVTPPTS